VAVTNTLKSKHCPINTTKFNYEIRSAFCLSNVILYQVVVLILDLLWQLKCNVLCEYVYLDLQDTALAWNICWSAKVIYIYVSICVKCCPGCINIDFDRQILEKFLCFYHKDSFTFPYCKLQSYLNYSCKVMLTDIHKLLCNVLPNLAYITGIVSRKLTYWQR
jgi:hypothetical protein